MDETRVFIEEQARVIIMEDEGTPSQKLTRLHALGLNIEEILDIAIAMGE